MKVCILTFLCMIALSCSNPYKDVVNTDMEYQVIPKPVSMNMSTGRFLVDGGTGISFAPGLENEAHFLSGLLEAVSHVSVPVSQGSESGSGNILLQLTDSMDHAEGYHLTVNYDKIVIAGKTARGVFYGIQSLAQLLSVDTTQSGSATEWTIPAVKVADSPRFAYRGMMLDVARHFFPVDFIKNYLNILALHKMNTFHWHLTDDQGWRIEIKKYPRLTEVGAYRNGTITGHYPGTGNDQKRYGGFYTQDEVKEIIAYAADRHITIIPEIEMPGHASAAIAAYPYLSCFPDEPTIIPHDMMSTGGRDLQKSGTPKIVQETWGVMDDVYCAGKETTFAFLEDVLTEVIALFPSKYIHIGGDECPKGNWKRCPDCQASIREMGLENEEELQSYFIHRIEKFLNSKGRSIIGWDEIMDGGLSPTATVMYWRGWLPGVPAKVAVLGNDIIMTPTGYSYFDAYQVDSSLQKNEPLAIGGYTSVEKVYSFEIIPENIPDDQKQQLRGAQANLWTEYIATGDHVEYMVLPRMAALAEVVWSPENTRTWENFRDELPHLAKIYDRKEWNFAGHVID